MVARKVFSPVSFALALALIVVATSASAQSVRVLGEHNAWSAYSTTESAGQICFVMSRPSSTEPLPAGFSQAYFYITHRPAQNIRSEINLVAGFEFMPDSVATLSIGSQTYDLFTEGDSAWLADPSQTNAVVAAIRAGSTMSISGTALSGQTVRQSFSLSGATAATRAIDAAC